MLHEPATRASLGALLEMQNLRPQRQPTKSGPTPDSWPNSFLLEFMKMSIGKRPAKRLWLLDKEGALRTNCTETHSGGLMCFLSVDQMWATNQGAARSCYESCPRIPLWRDTFQGWGIKSWMPEAEEGICADLVEC